VSLALAVSITPPRALEKSAQASIDRLWTSYYCSEKARKVSFVQEFGLKHRLTVFVCVVLAILFLYNPYPGMASSPSGKLNIQHSLSYRATVGSSELQHFSPPDARKIFATPTAVATTRLESPIKFLVGQAAEVSTHHLCAYQLVCADLWFRPPPAN
jgi:hypothetical protein